MNTKQQIFLDSFIAKPIAYLFNILARIFGQILSINHNLDGALKSIAVCKFKGMGSILQATPMLAAIKKQHPNATLIFVSTKSNLAILEKIDSIDQIITIDDSSLFRFFISNIKSIIQLIKIRPEVYFDLEIYSDFSTLFTLFTLSVNRVGFYLRSSSFRMGIYTHMMFFNPRVPISSVYLHLTELIGCDTENLGLYPLANEITKPHKHENKYLVVNPNSSDLRLERRWDKNNFIELIRKLINDYQEYEVLLIGSKNERDYTQEIVNEIDNKRVINTAGKTSIEEVIGIINNSTLMITNDTGPMHLSFCLETPTICLFGPCSPEQYGMGKSAHIIYKKTYCSPCVHDFEIAPCNGNNICMQLIEVSEVYEKASQLLTSTDSEIKIVDTSKVVYNSEETILGIVDRLR